MTLEEDFHAAMVELYLRAKREIGYNAKYLIDMVSNDGGRETARYLLDTKEPSDGYVVLWENGRLDLSVEAEVLRPQWHDLFSDEQRAVAIRRLREYGFDVDAYFEGMRPPDPPPPIAYLPDPAADQQYAIAHRLADRYQGPATLTWAGSRDPHFDAAVYRDRCVGSLLAGALGDGLGSPVEGWSRDQIVARYGSAGITDLPAWGASRTDDTQLTVAVAESLLASDGRFDPEDFVARLVEWLPNGRGVGRATRTAIDELARGGKWDRVGPELDSSGNGAAMRTAPVGLIHALAPTPGPMLVDAVSFAVPTHGGEIGVAGAVAMATGVGLLARLAATGADTLDRVAFVDVLVAAIPDLETAPTPMRRPPCTPVYLRDRLRQIPSWLNRDPADVFAETWTGAFALESVPAAIFAFLRSPEDPRAVLLTGANASHDTDTIAAMAGNLVGAWLGADALRSHMPAWVDQVERCDELVRLAERLAELGWARVERGS